MKTNFHPISLILFTYSLVVAPALFAQGSGIESSRRSQSEIQRQANQIIAHIDAIIFDYTRNGLEGEELETLKRTRKNLSETSETEMARILELLSAAEQDSRNEEYLLEAFDGQKGILSVLRNLMSEYNERRDMAAVPLTLRTIIERQASNLAAAEQLARSTNPSRGLSDFQMQMVDAQFEEQRNINRQFDQWIASLEILAFSPEEEVAARFQKALGELQRMRIPNLLGQSLNALDAGQVVTAASFEKRSIESLKALLLTLDEEKPSEPGDEASFSLVAELQRLRDEEGRIREQIDKRIEKDQNLNPVVKNQGGVIESFYGLRDAMIQEMPDRSDLHTTVLDTMRLARREMADSAPSRRAQSAQTVDQVIAQLDGLIEQANAGAGTPPPEDPAEADESFAERLAIAVSEQERLNRETLAMERNDGRLRGALPRQETIARMASILHQQAHASYPDAARPLFDAGEDIQSALRNLPLAGREGLALMAQEKVLTHLRQALATLETEPAETDPSLLAEAIAEAQAKLEEAREAIEAEDFAEAAEELAEAAESVEEAGELATAMDPEMIPDALLADLEAAQAALAEALAALPEAGDLPLMTAAEGEVAPLEAALAAAAAALESALAGTGETGQSGEQSEFLESIAAQLAQGMEGAPTGEGEGEDGPPAPTQTAATTPMTAQESDGEGEGEYNSAGPEVAGTPGDLAADSAFTSLPERDRDAIRQSMSEPHPAAYRDFIEQYRRNLAESIQ